MAETNDGATLWVWQERSEDGRWGAIGFHEGTHPPHSFAPIIQLSTRTESIARVAFAEVARAHHRATGHPVRLAKFTISEIAETLT